MTEGHFDTGVDLGGLMAVLSQHLYSTPDVALRELVQNAHDSIARRHILEPLPPTPRIDVITNEAAGTIEVRDNGAGMTDGEFHRELATIGVGATRTMRDAQLTGPEWENETLIGLFGLGFLSAFVIADEVVVTSTSWRNQHEAWTYRSTDGHAYELQPAEATKVGTTVTLHLKDGFADLALHQRAHDVVRRYCRLLSYPIHVDGRDRINVDVPWRHSQPSYVDRMSFAAEIAEDFEPIAVIPIESDDQWLSGQVWIHATSTYGNADNRSIGVYVRGMLLAENDRDLLPRWAGFVSGIIESPKLTPTASRETLQEDGSYTEAQMAISEALIVGLSDLALSSPAEWRRVVRRHGEALLGAAISDDRLFDLVADQVLLPTSQGDLSVTGLRVGQRVHVSLGAARGFEEALFLIRDIPVARGDRYGVLQFLRAYAKRYGIELVEIGTDRGNKNIFEPAEIDADDLSWLATELAAAGEAVVAARFEPTNLPLAVIPDRGAELKRQVEDENLDKTAGPGLAGLARLHTASINAEAEVRVYVNVACPTIVRLLDSRVTNPVGTTRVVTLLRTLKSLMAASDKARGGAVDLDASFRDFLSVLDGLLTQSPGMGNES